MKNTPSTKVLRSVAEMRRFAADARRRGRRVALVPTMGALHEGHLALVKAARRRADLVVVSIFVNPTQFGPREDLSAYPSDLPGDLAKLAPLGVAAVFTPEARELFPAEHRTWVEVEDLSQRLCGRSRPTHFRGVATVVAKLLEIVAPHHAWFGQKDYQQLLIVRRLARDLNFETEILDVPTVRDADGLALSSRNAYLAPEHRPAALTLRQALGVAERLIAKGERSAAKIISNMREMIRLQPGAEIEYLAIVHPETLHDLESVEIRSLVAVAVRVGRARLIDNVLVDLRDLQQARPAAVAGRPAAARDSARRKAPPKAAAAARRVPARAAAAKKAAPKKPAARKPAAKKPATKKPAGKKPAPRRAATPARRTARR